MHDQFWRLPHVRRATAVPRTPDVDRVRRRPSRWLRPRVRGAARTAVRGRALDEPGGRSAFLAWLDGTFGITPADDWEEIVDAAQAELEAEWAAWIHPLVPDAVWSPNHELNLLARFGNRLYKGYANGFWLLDAYGERERIRNPALTADMTPFAENDTDTVFALDAGGRVLAVGKTAGIHPVARDLREFFQLIAALTETEIWCDEHQVGLRPCEPAPLRDKYLEWLETTLDLRPADDPEAVIRAAQTP
ncbi:hypothetical protein [Actinomadura gamaensis]|uniref:SMI1/KNR4 family protein n=1 Tax=Actinomadura gamaensis TaxID=1763541 RepID=A0ABV9UB17_9ACTN